MANEIDTYAEQYSSEIDPILDELYRETHLKCINPRMLSGKIQGLFLNFFVKSKSISSILEIGTYTGFATICMANALPQGGTISTIEANPEYQHISQKYFDRPQYQSKIHAIIGDAKSTIPKLNKQFDLAYIDADKQNNMNYIELIYPLLKPDGWILIDNVLWSGKVIDEKERLLDTDTKLIHDMNVALAKDARFEVMILPIRDGISILRKKGI